MIYNKDDFFEISINKYISILEDLEIDLKENIISSTERLNSAKKQKNKIVEEYLSSISEDTPVNKYIREYKKIKTKLDEIDSNYVSYDIQEYTAVAKYKEYLKSLDAEKRNKILTGFYDFDETVKGISSGLTIITGLSSLGKSTFCTQLADQIAFQGNKVIYLNAEMQDSHVFSKSITRLSGKYYQLSFYDILNIGDCTFKPKLDSFQKSLEDFKTYGSNIVIKQASKNWSAELRQDIKALTKINDNKPPVIFIDYIQILPELPNSQSRGNEFAMINEHINELKRIIQETGAYIVAISSLSRASYERGISLSSLKGSGNLEYSAEMVLAIEPSRHDCCDGKPIYDLKKCLFDMDLINDWKKMPNKKVSLRVLKNRMGATGDSFDLLFESSKAKFTEVVNNFHNLAGN